jgi:hypothetical protein
VLISKNWPSDPHFGLEGHEIKSLDDFRVHKANLLEKIEEKFKNCLEEFVDSNDVI